MERRDTLPGIPGAVTEFSQLNFMVSLFDFWFYLDAITIERQGNARGHTLPVSDRKTETSHKDTQFPKEQLNSMQ